MFQEMSSLTSGMRLILKILKTGIKHKNFVLPMFSNSDVKYKRYGVVCQCFTSKLKTKRTPEI